MPLQDLEAFDLRVASNFWLRVGRFSTNQFLRRTVRVFVLLDSNLSPDMVGGSCIPVLPPAISETKRQMPIIHPTPIAIEVHFALTCWLWGK